MSSFRCFLRDYWLLNPASIIPHQPTSAQKSPLFLETALKRISWTHCVALQQPQKSVSRKRWYWCSGKMPLRSTYLSSYIVLLAIYCDYHPNHSLSMVTIHKRYIRRTKLVCILPFSIIKIILILINSDFLVAQTTLATKSDADVWLNFSKKN